MYKSVINVPLVGGLREKVDGKLPIDIKIMII
jgi:hypothetical protein